MLRFISRMGIALMLIFSILAAPPQVSAANLDAVADRYFGQPNFTGNSYTSPSDHSFNFPAATALDGQGNLYVADTDHHRVLVFFAPLSSGMSASRVLGQADFTSAFLNRGAAVSANTLGLPGGVALDSQGNLFVADTYNNRVLEYFAPLTNGMDAGRVFGQANFSANQANRGGALNSAGLNSPGGIALDASGSLFVADRDNNRVLQYSYPLTSAMNASLVLGQAGFGLGQPNRGSGPTANSLNYPRDVDVTAGFVSVSDAMNNRVLVFNRSGLVSGAAASLVIGQVNFTTAAIAAASATSLNYPTSLVADAAGNLYVADSGNDRVLEYDLALVTNMPASRVFGQPNLTTGTSNTNGVSSSSLSALGGVALDAAGNLYVADLGNHRLLEYDLPVPHQAMPILAFSPYSVASGSPDFTLTVNGSGFVPGATVRLNGSDRPTTYLNGGQLNAAISAADVASGGNKAIQVFIPAPGGGLSASAGLVVYARSPLDGSADGLLGQANFSTNQRNSPLLPGWANRVYGPTAIVVDPKTGRVFMADVFNHRVLSWPNLPVFANSQAADLVLGQPDFDTILSNQGGVVSASSLSWPNGLALDGDGNLYVADQGNNRVVEFATPLSSGMAASRVIGQATFSTNASGSPSASNLDGPMGVALDRFGNLYVADSNNHRVLEYQHPLGNGMSATNLFGQANFTSNLIADPPTDKSLNFPMGLALDPQGKLYVADNGNSRVLVYDNVQGLVCPGSCPASLVIGQPNFTTSATGPASPTSLNNPYAVALDPKGNLYVADTLNNRVLEYNLPLANGMMANLVIGQANQTSAFPTAGPTGLTNPSALALDPAGNLYVADLSNSRVLEYDLPLPHAVSSLGSLSPDALAKGSPAFTLTVNGTGFYPSSIVRWNGSDRPTTYLSSTRLSAAIPASDALAVGTPAVTVFTPAPGGGISTPANLSIYARTTQDTTADGILGQPNFGSNTSYNPVMGEASRLNYPAQMTVDPHSGRLFLVVEGNRILSWPSAPAFANGQAADLVIGQPDFHSLLANQGGSASASSLNTPIGVALDGQGNLYVSDFGNSRVLGFSPPFSSGMSASLVFGQANFSDTSINRGGSISASGLFVPRGVAVDGQGNLFVSDHGNNRVLVFYAPLSSGMAANVVIGQADFGVGLPNRGSVPGPNTLSAARGLALDGQGNLYAADTDNNRVLVFSPPFSNGMSASTVIGQLNFTSVAANRGSSAAAATLGGPREVAADGQGNLYVADIGNQRVLEYNAPLSNGMAANRVFGQANFSSVSANRGGSPTASTLYNPYGITLDGQGNLYIGDTVNARLLEYDLPILPAAPTLSGLSPAAAAAGGPGFSLAVSGTGFVAGSTVYWNGSPCPTTYLSSTRLLAAIPASAIVADGSAAVTVITPAPGGGGTALMNLEVYLRSNQDTLADGVLGQPGFQSGVADNPDLIGWAGRLSSPVALAVDLHSGRLFVVDKDNSRVLSWPDAPAFQNGAAADLVIGQANFVQTAPNQGGSVSPSSLAGPLNVAVDAKGNLYVADSGNHRVLEYNAPLSSGMPANLVFGQGGNLSIGLANNGGINSNSLNMPVGLALDGQGNLYIADVVTHRVLEYNTPLVSGFTADRVFGQASMGGGTANYDGVNNHTLNVPAHLVLDGQGNLYVSDNANQRVLEFDTPLTSDMSADRVFGQASFSGFSPNAGGTTNDHGFNQPGGLCLDRQGSLYVSDSANQRVLVFFKPLAGAVSAGRVFGQGNFSANQANAGGSPSAGSLFSPSGLALDGLGNLYVADNANRRVLEFDLPNYRLRLPLIMR